MQMKKISLLIFKHYDLLILDVKTRYLDCVKLKFVNKVCSPKTLKYSLC